ncbi:MAG: Magnesium transport protein CorA [Chlamydiales bacterium]|nr:Magnesium transport protein CorA [Chlamydiales bacterium]
MLQYAKDRTVLAYQNDSSIDQEGFWYDLFDPDPHEVHTIEEAFQLHVPSRADMKEIEASSRLFVENDLLYMTVNVLSKAEGKHPFLSPITFILNEKRLITLRYANPRPFQIFARKLERNYRGQVRAEQVCLNILEAIVDRIADILEMIGAEIDAISTEIFKSKEEGVHNQRELKEVLTHIGKKGDLSTKTRESLEGISRLLIFFSHHVEEPKIALRLRTLQRDVSSVSDHVNFLFNKINFLLDATLGFINIEQNNIVKILSVAAVVFLPPTLIASIYGMNFDIIPELHWGFGYPLAILLMVVTATIPYFFCKRKGWL